MEKFYVPAKGTESWRLLLADPEKHWKKDFSAFELATKWHGSHDFPDEIRAVLEGDPKFEGIELLLGIPEHQVHLPGGIRPSQTDLWVLAKAKGDLISIAVEGKVDESFGPTIGEWDYSSTPGREERLKYLCSLLGLSFPPATDIRYQLFHRTASAIIEAKRFLAKTAVMLVHSFSSQYSGFADYAAFLSQFGVEAPKNQIVSAGSHGGINLFFGWVKA